MTSTPREPLDAAQDDPTEHLDAGTAVPGQVEDDAELVRRDLDAHGGRAPDADAAPPE